MKNNICQSCTMPIENPELKGSEKDGSPSNDYCIYCYQHGVFTRPHLTLGEMKTMVKTQMQKKNIDPILIQMAIKNLPYLKRWKVSEPVL